MHFLHRQPVIQDRIGFHIKPFSRSSPIPNRFELLHPADKARVHLPFIYCPDSPADELLEALAAFRSEWESVSFDDNPWYTGFDACTLYAMVRHMKPRQLVEVGSGFSTMVIQSAVKRNAADGYSCAVTCIDPRPRRLESVKADTVRWIDQPVQAISARDFPALGAGDILFIDSSHILKMQSDVLYLFTEILPLLPPDALVHVHDIFIPYDYPEKFSLETCHMNEQYALECILANSPDWEVILPLYHLYRDKTASLATLGITSKAAPTAFWMRKKQVR